MDLSDRNELAGALDRLSAALGIAPSAEALEEYLSGREWASAGYEKLMLEEHDLPAFSRYSLVARSYLAQPDAHRFYDIFRAARVIPLLRRLDMAVRGLAEGRVAGLDTRLARLASANRFDEFDAVLFELVTAAKYGETAGFERVVFIAEQPGRKKTPEFCVSLSSGDVFVECKRLDRMTIASVKLRDKVRDATRPTLDALRIAGRSAVIEVIFPAHPDQVDPDELRDAALDALRSGGWVLATGARVRARILSPRRLENFVLFPGPEYFSARYGYVSGEWHGVVPHLKAKWAGPSFLDAIDWEAAVLWRVEDEDAVWSVQRLAFTTVFEGIEQLGASDGRGVLHVWFERSAEHGHRQRELFKLLDALVKKQKLDFSWIIANETLSDVSATGYFDFQEHATPIPGAQAQDVEGPPIVTNVFIEDSDVHGVGEWGIGLRLPPVDKGPTG